MKDSRPTPVRGDEGLGDLSQPLGECQHRAGKRQLETDQVDRRKRGLLSRRHEAGNRQTDAGHRRIDEEEEEQLRGKIPGEGAGEMNEEPHPDGLNRRKASEEEDYRSYFHMLDEASGSPLVKDELKRVMKTEGLDAELLENRNGLVPGQPGMKDQDITVEEEKYGMPWCLDTWSKSKFLSVCSWPTRYTCNGCKMKQICMACARKCHKGHGLIVHMTAKKKGDRVSK